MFGIGLGEILLVSVALFLLFPTKLPEMLRKLGKAISVLRRFQRQYVDDFFRDTPLERGKKEGKEVKVRGGDFDKQPDVAALAATEESIQNADVDGMSRSEKATLLHVMDSRWTPHFSPNVLKLLFDEDEAIRQKAFRLLLMDPLFAFESRFSDPGSKPVPRIEEADPGARHIGSLFTEERIAQLSTIAAQIPEHRFKASLLHLSMLPGSIVLDPRIVFGGSHSPYYAEFRRLYDQSLADKYMPQVTVTPSYACNFPYSYSFDRGLSARFPDDMELETFSQLLGRIKKENAARRVNIFGGEPTVFPGIAEFVHTIVDNGMEYHFATKGTTPPEVFNRSIEPGALGSVTFHVMRDDRYTSGQLQAVVENMEYVQSKGTRVILRYNITAPEEDDWMFLLRYFGFLTRFDFSFAVAFPSGDGSNDHVRVADLARYKNAILSLLLFLVDHAQRIDVNVALCKPYPLCVFASHELSLVLRFATVKNVCEIDRNGFMNNLCVNPDLSYFPCIALTSESDALKGFQDLSSIPEAYVNKMERTVRSPLMEKCSRCILHARGVCQAACYAYLNR